ncbi:transposase-like zinc-binding domain-containing protein [Dokdonia ponticola]
MKCKNCNASNCIKKGKRSGKQRYHCKSCNLIFN